MDLRLYAITRDAPELDRLARWLAGRDRKLEAARMLRELAVSFPDSEAAAPALLGCGELLLELGMADKARSILAAVQAKYPDSTAAGQARGLLEEMR